MRIKLSVILTALTLSSVYGAFDASYHFNNLGSNGSGEGLTKDQVCSFSVYYSNTEIKNGVRVLKTGESFDLLPSDILYAPAFIYKVNDSGLMHCENNQASRKWFEEDIKGKAKPFNRREIKEITMDKKTYGLPLMNNEEKLNKLYAVRIISGDNSWEKYEWSRYFDQKIASKYGMDIFKTAYIKNDQTNLPLKLSVSDGLSKDKQLIMPLVNGVKSTPLTLNINGKESYTQEVTAHRMDMDKFNENIHQIIVPSGITGVVDTFLSISPVSQTKAATYFLTQDLKIDDSLKYQLEKGNVLFRKINGGNSGIGTEERFSTPKNMKYDVSSLGLLDQSYFENAVYKNTSNAYQTDIYTMHGDFLNRFITGFGPNETIEGWGFDNTYTNSYKYDSGWLNHRYLKSKDKSYGSSSDLLKSFGLNYDKYDPVTTYIDLDELTYESITGSKNIVYKQYAIDDKDNTSNLAIHVRPLFAQAKQSKDSYIKDEELLTKYGIGGVTYTLGARFYPDPKQVLSLRPIKFDISNLEMAYNSDIKVNADYSDFVNDKGQSIMDTWYNGPNAGKPAYSKYGLLFQTNGERKICGWYQTAYDGPPAFVCEGSWDPNRSSHSKAAKYDEYHAIKVEYADLIKGIDIFKLAVDNTTPVPARKSSNNYQKDNGKYQTFKLAASLENVYYGNDIQHGSSYSYNSGGYVYNHKEGKSEYFVGFQWGGNSEFDVAGRCPNCPKGTRYDVGLKGKVEPKQQNIMDDLALINFNLELRLDYDINGIYTYIGHIKLTDEGKAALTRIQAKVGNQDSIFNIKIYNLYDENTGRIIPFNEPFKIKANGELPYDAKANVASNIGNNEAATHANGNYIVYDQIAGIAVKEQNIATNANNLTFDKNINGDGGHFLIAKDKDNADKEIFLQVILQKQAANGAWEDLGDVVLKDYCVYKAKNGFCKIGRYGAGISEYNLNQVFGTEDGYGDLASTLLINYNYLKPSENYPFTLQSVANSENYRSGKTYGVIYKSNEAKEKANEVGLFRFKVANLNKNEILRFFKDNKLGYNDGCILENNRCDWSEAHTTKWKNNFKAFAYQDKYMAYSSTFVIRPGFSRISSMLDNAKEYSLDKNAIDFNRLYFYTRGGNHLSYKSNTYYNQRIIFDFYNSKLDNKNNVISSNVIENDKLHSIDKSLVKLSLLYDASGLGNGRLYLLNQKNALNTTIGITSPTLINFTNDTFNTDVKIKSPYAGNGIGIFGLTYFGDSKNIERAQTCDSSATRIEKQNKAIKGKYGCFPEPIVGLIDFGAKTNVLCKASNQFAFFREREGIADDERLKKFNNENLYNITYQCVKKYVDDNGNALYNIGDYGCNGTGSNMCNKKVATIEKNKITFDISGGLTNQDAYSKGLNVWLYDANYIIDPNQIEPMAKAFCTHYLNDTTISSGERERRFNNCVDNEKKNKEFGIGANAYYDYYSNNGDFITNVANMNARFSEAIHQDLGNPTRLIQAYVFSLNGLDAYFKGSRTKSIYEVDISDTNTYNKDFKNTLGVTNIGTNFIVSVSQARKEKLEPIIFTEKISDDTGSCDSDKEDCSTKILGNEKSVLKYGVLEVEDIVLKNKLDNANEIIINNTNSNNSKMVISVYENGRFNPIRSSVVNKNIYDFNNAKKNIDFAHLKNSVAGRTTFAPRSANKCTEGTSNGYCIDDTMLVDITYNLGADNEELGYKIRSKNISATSSSFSDNGVIYTKSGFPLFKILRPTTNTIKVIYKEKDSGEWHGVKNY